MIELKNITKTFLQKDKSLLALSDVSLDVPAGSVYGVIGASGAGKSTLIRCVNLLERPDSGIVVVNGTDLTLLSAAALAKQRRRIGMIFQHFNLLSSRTVFDNIAFPLELDKISKQQIRERVTELLNLVGLGDKANAYPAQLSGGQKQRVAIARTLANKPDVLLCDEATSALDPATTRSILDLLRKINSETGITILLITHQMEVVKAICDRAAVISGGRIVEAGRISDILRSNNVLIRSLVTIDADTKLPPEYRGCLLNSSDSENRKTIIKLELTDDQLKQPILTDLGKLFDLNVRLLHADMEYYTAGGNYGLLLLEFDGLSTNDRKALNYLKNKQINTEILGYV